MIDQNLLEKAQRALVAKLNTALSIKAINFLFDSDLDFTIFGGAIRDSLAGQEIHDIDILCLPYAFTKLVELLTNEGFIQSRACYDIEHLYAEIGIIHYPATFLKNGLSVQLIRPRLNKFGHSFAPDKCTDSNNLEVFYSVLSNVDLSCCGVYLQRRSIYESTPNAIKHCIKNVFSVMPHSKMASPKRLASRIEKLEIRNWKKL